MEQFKGMTDEELISALKKYSIPHGPVVGTTRKLYEKKIYEYETQRTKHSPSKQTYTYSDSDSPLYESKRYDVLSREGRSGGSPAYQLDASSQASGGVRADIIGETAGYGTYTSKTEGPSGPEESDSQFCERQQYDLPRDRDRISGRVSYQDKGDDYYSESYSTTKTYSEPPVRQRLRDEFVSSSNTESKYYSKENAYQNVSQYSSASGSSLSVEPRRGIREKPKEVEQTPARRFCPLWLQFLLLFLIIGFLAFVYFFVQPEDENPFKEIPN
ncbi:emerin isoform X2 [Pleurodeles waltl]|uniref:emerin isoform X2 n=1 Tax=Pleurodeles waltl TaxID=8319 RepID=UPI003709BBB4